MSRPRGPLLLALALALAGGPAAARTDCSAYAALFAAGRWVEAEAMIQRLLIEGECRRYTSDLYYSLALALDRQQPPRSPCHIAQLYRAVADDADLPSEQRAAAKARADDFDERCAARRPPAPGPAPLPEASAPSLEPLAPDGIFELADDAPRPPPPAPARLLPWTLTLGAGAAALVGGSLLGLALSADAERARAEARLKDYQLRLASGALLPPEERARLARTRADFDAAAGRAGPLAIGGWATLGLGLGLAIAAGYAWQATPDGPSVGLAPGGLTLSFRLWP